MELNLAKISIRHSSLVIRHSIKNIIFDFGGVICNIDVNLTKQKFIGLGMKKPAPGKSLVESTDLFDALETGTIGSRQFREKLKSFFMNTVSDEHLDEAWNALLLDIPGSRIRLLEEVRKTYRIFLLSNSNEIHYKNYLESFRKQFGYEDFNALFEKAYFSFQLGLRKPSPEIFLHVLRDSRLDPAETLFIDDTLIHVEGANRAGIHAHHLALEKREEIADLFL